MTKRVFERLEFRRLLSADALWVPEHVATSTLKADIQNEAGLFDLVYYSKAPSGSTAFHLNDDDVPDLAVYYPADDHGLLEVFLGSSDGHFELHSSYTGLWSTESVDQRWLTGKLAAADLNHDGFDDLIVSDYHRNQARVFLRDPDSTTLVGLEVMPSAEGDLSLHDVNQDGHLDLVREPARRNPDSTIMIQLGQGTGKFDHLVAYEGSFLVADLNNDGFVDLVGYGSSGYQVLENDGFGNFESPLSTTRLPAAGHFVDVNSDGSLDVISDGPSYSVYLGRGDGTFSDAVDELNLISIHFDDFEFGDFTGDGNIDLAIYDRIDFHDRRPHGLSVLVGGGDGTFGEPIRIHSRPQLAAIGPHIFDLDADGTSEILVSSGHEFRAFTGAIGNTWDLELFTFKLRPATTIAGPLIHFPPPSSLKTEWRAVDINGDGFIDQIGLPLQFGIINSLDDPGVSGEIYLRMGHQGGFGELQVVELGYWITEAELIVHDADRDGRADVVVYGHEMKPNFPEHPNCCVSRSHFTFVQIEVGQTESVAHATQVINAPIWGRKEVVDINQDGMLDVLAVKYPPFDSPNRDSLLLSYINQGDFEFVEIEGPTLPRSGSFQIADANGDQYPDIFLNTSADANYLINNSGDGTWGWTNNPPPPTKSTEQYFVDLNNDETADIVRFENEFAIGGSTSLSVAIASSRSSFEQPKVIHTFTHAPSHITPIDLNRDGNLDLLLTIQEDSGTLVRTMFGDGTGNFSNPVDTPVGDFAELVVSDLNGDAFLDFTTEDARVFLGQESGEFIASGYIVAQVSTTPFATEVDVYADDDFIERVIVPGEFSHRWLDLDQDGHLDLVGVSGDGLFVVPGLTTTRPVIPGDFNEDGLADVHDIAILRSAQKSGDLQELMDLNGDQLVNESDVEFFVQDIARTRIGDADLNGEVNFRDFIALATSFGKTDATWQEGDFDGDGEVSFRDFVALASNFGFGRPR